MLKSLADTFFELSVVVYPRFSVGILMISIMLYAFGDRTASSLGGHIAISGCRSLSKSFRDTAVFEFAMVNLTSCVVRKNTFVFFFS